jgi:UDP-N-acetylglucosamine 2-epimerase (non-hydrolysing)
MRVVSVFGTRPEAIKMAPVVKALEKSSGIESIVCSTGQHKEMLVPVLKLFDIKPDHELSVMLPGQNLNALFARTLTRTAELLEELKPDRVLVHGDTTTAAAAAMAAFHQNIPLGHVEAGLRTGNMHEPWPEEMNRRLIDGIGDQLYAPTDRAKQNLLDEHLGERNIQVTGNTVIDALLMTKNKLAHDVGLSASIEQSLPAVAPGKHIILVTGHRRENFGSAFEEFCQALKTLAMEPDIEIIYPVHLNPNVQAPVKKILSGLDNVHLISPLDYPAFVYLMNKATLIISDSGGVQEEAPSLGKMVLVTRNVTERPEAVDAGTVELVGTDKTRIYQRCMHYLRNPDVLQQVAQAKNPYGDGQAAQRIVKEISK